MSRDGRTLNLAVRSLLAQTANAFLQAVTQAAAALNANVGVMSVGVFHFGVSGVVASDVDRISRIECAVLLLSVVILHQVASLFQLDAAIADFVGLQSTIEGE